MSFRPDFLEWYMKLVDALEKTARENDAPPEMINHLAGITALYLDKRPHQTQH
jgi:hypothetical protein